MINWFIVTSYFIPVNYDLPQAGQGPEGLSITFTAKIPKRGYTH